MALLLIGLDTFGCDPIGGMDYWMELGFLFGTRRTHDVGAAAPSSGKTRPEFLGLFPSVNTLLDDGFLWENNKIRTGIVCL